MKTRNKYISLLLIIILQACSIPSLVQKEESNTVPESFQGSTDTTNTANLGWRTFFQDPYLVALIDTALHNNQELNIVLQEIEVLNNEVREKKGEYLPFIQLGGGLGADKVGAYTREGAVEHNLEIMPDKEFPEPLGDFFLKADFSWEVDIWKKLRNQKKAAIMRYLSSIEGKNFLVTNLVAEIAHTYYELLALDNMLENVNSNIEIQQNALKIVKLQKNAAKTTELAVRKFEAEVLKNKSARFYIKQAIVEKENEINFLIGRFPQPVERNAQDFIERNIDTIYAGIPSQLLDNRPDIRTAMLDLEAAKIDVQVAKANFYPSLDIRAGLGIQAFNPAHIVTFPESMAYSLAGDLVAPLVNRNAIKAQYIGANAKKIQAIYSYEQSILKAHIEVMNELSRMENLRNSFELKEKQVEALNQSITISNNLFKSAKADYMEVLMTQRDALEAKMELIETKKEQLSTLVNIYQALGGGWKE